MTPSKRAKQIGATNLKQVAEATKQSTQTLSNWFYDKPELFEIVVIGTIEKAKHDANN